VVRKTVTFEERAISFGNDIQDLMQVFHPDFVGEFLGGSKVRDFQEYVVVENIRNGTLSQSSS
jgi:hypothetical protein